jgi:hypothetical protein
MGLTCKPGHQTYRSQHGKNTGGCQQAEAGTCKYQKEIFHRSFILPSANAP